MKLKLYFKMKLKFQHDNEGFVIVMFLSRRVQLQSIDKYIKKWYNIYEVKKNMNELKVSDLDVQNKLLFRRGDYNILDCGVRTGKTYWAVNNLTQFTRDGKANRILFLVDTTALKD